MWCRCQPRDLWKWYRRKSWVHSDLGLESCVSSCARVMWVQETDQWLWGTLRCMKEGNKTAQGSHQSEKTKQCCHLCACAVGTQDSSRVTHSLQKPRCPVLTLALLCTGCVWNGKKKWCIFQPHGVVSRILEHNTQQSFVFGPGFPEKWSSNRSGKTLLWGSRQMSETVPLHN